MAFTNDLLYLLLLYAVLDDSNTLTTTTGVLIGAGIMLFNAFFGNGNEDGHHCHDRHRHECCCGSDVEFFNYGNGRGRSRYNYNDLAHERKENCFLRRELEEERYEHEHCRRELHRRDNCMPPRCRTAPQPFAFANSIR